MSFDDIFTSGEEKKIHNWPLQPFSQLLTPLMLCALILYVSGGTYNLKCIPNNRFLRNFFMACLFYSQIFCQKSTKRKRPKNFFLISYWCLTWNTNRGFMSNKPTKNYGNFIHKWLLQSLSQDSNLASYTTYAVCINFIHEWRNLQFKVGTEQQIFEKVFQGQFFICQKSTQKIFVHISFYG